jgi:hypothetical protein
VSSGAAPREIGGTNQLTLGITSHHKPYKYTVSRMRDQAVLINSGLSGGCVPSPLFRIFGDRCGLWLSYNGHQIFELDL